MPEGISTAPDRPIDAVIPWVDGSDPVLAEKRNKYIGNGRLTLSSGAHPTRFASLNEIRYCLLSIFRFAPFVRNVFIVTDRQNPALDDEVEKYFPGRSGSVRIVDHTEIFKGYEEWLPTFNSRSIVSMIWRIRGLSDNFICFNDDTILVRPTTPSDWFIDGRPVLRGRWVPAPLPRVLFEALRSLPGRLLPAGERRTPRASFHSGQWRAARLTGYRLRYFTNSHTPHTLSSKVIEEFFSTREGLLRQNISHRFRDNAQYDLVSLSNHLQLSTGNRHITRPGLLYLKPENRRAGYVDGKIRYFYRNRDLLFVCAQSLDRCTRADRERLFGWLDEVLGLT